MKLGFYLLVILGIVCIDRIVAQDDGDGDEETNGEEMTELPSDDDDDDDSPDIKEENDVLVLTAETFQQALVLHPVILVEFYAPWCGHCKTLAPKFEAAAKKLKENTPPVALAKVDATVEESLASEYDVSGYPTLVFFKDGEKYSYEGERSEEGIISFMTGVADPSWKPPATAVIDLTESTFDDFVNENELSLVEFYAPWCGHCKRLAPEFEKAAAELLKEDPPIPLAKVDATAESALAQRFGVSGYPTLKIFRNGQDYEYNGERESYGIVHYMRKQHGDASKLMSTCKDLTKSLKQDDVTVLGFFKSEDEKAFKVYKEAGNINRENYDFVHTFDTKCREQYKANPNSVVVVHAERFHTKYEGTRYPMEIKEDTTADVITDFIKSHDVPLVGEFSQTTKDKRYKDKRPLVLVFYMVDFGFQYRDATQLWRKKIADIAKDFKELTFAVADEENTKDVFQTFGFEDSAEDLNIAILGEKDQKFPMEPMEEFDSDEIRSFLKNFQKGKLKPHLKSQAVPKKQTGPVTVVVAKNFDQIVNDPKKDVLIEFYAPWCGHCKSLEPKYKKLAKKYASEENLVIAKMDATANDVMLPYVAQGFPTIYFSPAGDKNNPVKYEASGREVDDFVAFLKLNVKNSLGNSLKEEL